MPFQFTPYQPDTRSILELMTRGPAARAAALRASGEAQARAMEIGGQARAQAAQNIGQSISGSIGELMKQREEAPYRAAQIAELQARAEDRAAATQARTQAGVDQRTIDHILQEGGDPESIVDKLRTSGNAHLIPQVQKSFDDAAARKAAYDKTVADTAKSTADAAETQQKIATAHADYLGGISADIAAHHYDPTAFFHGVALAHNDGMIDRVTAGKAIALGIQNPDQIKAFVDARIAASPEQRKLATEQAKTAAAAANTAADNARADAAATETARHNKAMEARPVAGAVSANIPGNFDVTGDAFLDSIPKQWRKTVEKIAKYDEDPTKVASMRGGMREALTTWVNQVNPAYDQSKFAIRSSTRKAFTTGTQGQQLNAINTALGHIDQLTDVAAQVQSGGFVPANKAWNALRTTFGSDKVTNFDTLKDALAGEVASVLSKSGATVSGIAEAREKISAANSPTQLAGYVNTLIPIMGSKLAELDDQFHQAMGDDTFSALSAQSKTILAKHGFDPTNPQIRQAAGGTVAPLTKPIPGIPGAEATSTDGGKTWKRTK